MKLLIDSEWKEILKDYPIEKQMEISMCVLFFPERDCDANIWQKVIKPKLIAEQKKYSELCQKRVEFGHFGGRPTTKNSEKHKVISEKHKVISNESKNNHKVIFENPTVGNGNGHCNGSFSIGVEVLEKGMEREVTGYPLGETAPPQKKSEIEKSILDCWNRIAAAHGLAAIVSLSKARLAKASARLDDCRKRGVDFWVTIDDGIAKSAFLRGQNERYWRCDFDFATSESGFLKISEGKYSGKKLGGDPSPKEKDPLWFLNEGENDGK